LVSQFIPTFLATDYGEQRGRHHSKYRSRGGKVMREFAGKAVFVTGGASGIGLALGRAFAEAGCKVMLADIEKAALDAAVASLADSGPEIRGVVCDVADSTSVDAAAEATLSAFGKVHILCNNAGVGARGGIDHIALDNWRWVLDINLMGVVNGVRSFLPHMRAHGEGGHIVNTASMAGMVNSRQAAYEAPAAQNASNKSPKYGTLCHTLQARRALIGAVLSSSNVSTQRPMPRACCRRDRHPGLPPRSG
jgi:hypothetical protein